MNVSPDLTGRKQACWILLYTSSGPHDLFKIDTRPSKRRLARSETRHHGREKHHRRYRRWIIPGGPSAVN